MPPQPDLLNLNSPDIIFIRSCILIELQYENMNMKVWTVESI